MGKTGSRSYFRTLLLLVLLGALTQACSDNKGPAGPSFPAGQVGHSDFPEGVLVNVFVNPNTVEVGQRAGITVVATTPTGVPLVNRRVQVGTTFGRLDTVDGFTDGFGKFVTFLFCDRAGSAGITALVEGAAAPAGAVVICAAPVEVGGTTGTTTTTP